MIVRWPGHVPAGTTSDYIGYFADFLPTAAELAGIESPPKTDGISFVPTLLGHPDRQKPHDFLYWEFYEGKNGQAVRSGRWKGIVKPFASDHFELYDLETDPGEDHDVAAQHPEIVARLRQIIREQHVPSPEWKVPSQKPARMGTPKKKS